MRLAEIYRAEWLQFGFKTTPDFGRVIKMETSQNRVEECFCERA
jgi:hypothetical protein